MGLQKAKISQMDQYDTGQIYLIKLCKIYQLGKTDKFSVALA